MVYEHKHFMRQYSGIFIFFVGVFHIIVYCKFLVNIIRIMLIKTQASSINYKKYLIKIWQLVKSDIDLQIDDQVKFRSSFLQINIYY